MNGSGVSQEPLDRPAEQPQSDEPTPRQQALDAQRRAAERQTSQMSYNDNFYRPGIDQSAAAGDKPPEQPQSDEPTPRQQALDAQRRAAERQEAQMCSKDDFYRPSIDQSAAVGDKSAEQAQVMNDATVPAQKNENQIDRTTQPRDDIDKVTRQREAVMEHEKRLDPHEFHGFEYLEDKERKDALITQEQFRDLDRNFGSDYRIIRNAMESIGVTVDTNTGKFKSLGLENALGYRHPEQGRLVFDPLMDKGFDRMKDEAKEFVLGKRAVPWMDLAENLGKLASQLENERLVGLDIRGDVEGKQKVRDRKLSFVCEVVAEAKSKALNKSEGVFVDPERVKSDLVSGFKAYEDALNEHSRFIYMDEIRRLEKEDPGFLRTSQGHPGEFRPR